MLLKQAGQAGSACSKCSPQNVAAWQACIDHCTEAHSSAPAALPPGHQPQVSKSPCHPDTAQQVCKTAKRPLSTGMLESTAQKSIAAPCLTTCLISIYVPRLGWQLPGSFSDALSKHMSSPGTRTSASGPSTRLFLITAAEVRAFLLLRVWQGGEACMKTTSPGSAVQGQRSNTQATRAQLGGRLNRGWQEIFQDACSIAACRRWPPFHRASHNGNGCMAYLGPAHGRSLQAPQPATAREGGRGCKRGAGRPYAGASFGTPGACG